MLSANRPRIGTIGNHQIQSSFIGCSIFSPESDAFLKNYIKRNSKNNGAVQTSVASLNYKSTVLPCFLETEKGYRDCIIHSDKKTTQIDIHIAVEKQAEILRDRHSRRRRNAP